MTSLPGMQIPQNSGYVSNTPSVPVSSSAPPSTSVAPAVVGSTTPSIAQPTQQQPPQVQQPILQKLDPPPQSHQLPPPPQLQVVLQNVTASVNMGIRVDLPSLASKVRNAEYNPKKFAACVMRIREPKATGMIFSSGKLVITGANGVRAAEEAGRKFVAVVKNQSLKPQFLNFTVQNIVATLDMGYSIDLELLAYLQARWCIYEPELFPGVIYQTERRGVVAHIFLSGRVVLTGAKSEEQLNDALPRLLPIITEHRHQDAGQLS